MPHTNRKKKSSLAAGERKTQPKIVHTKRQQIEDGDGWTHVVDTPRKTQLKVKAGLHMGDFERAGVAYVERTLEELGKDLEFYTRLWSDGEACGERKLPCVFQDPQFTDLDKEFLSSLGYSVVEDPLAFGHITEKSLVYAIHCYAQVYKSVAEGPRPAVVIGTDVENFGKFNLNETTENIAKDLEDMVQDCETIDFPQGKEADVVIGVLVRTGLIVPYIASGPWQLKLARTGTIHHSRDNGLHLPISAIVAVADSPMLSDAIQPLLDPRPPANSKHPPPCVQCKDSPVQAQSQKFLIDRPP
ncbi:hypothetical protein D0Z07_3035 [Hyphodiscus hymeniophilus]|uniref:SRR1-like domain-containing protein n=1 Tax=Hyphodiscus hymeniophilus TaxID=353542 RepID=A0A9P7AYV2_9HELO|nr:hypothetical protein D0Z07_3035 [Hyphodiscus hymeniophilus]